MCGVCFGVQVIDCAILKHMLRFLHSKVILCYKGLLIPPVLNRDVNVLFLPLSQYTNEAETELKF